MTVKKRQKRDTRVHWSKEDEEILKLLLLVSKGESNDKRTDR